MAAERLPVSFAGTLKRKSAFFGMWSKCYCEIRANEFCIRGDEKADKIERIVFLRDEVQILPSRENSHRFQIIVPNDQPLVFTAESESKVNEWILALITARFRFQSLTMDSFKIISVLGRGFFGKVMLCESNETKKLYAIKSVHKDLLIKSKRLQSILYERNILARISHPFIVSLCFAFQTQSKFYMGLDYQPGGELINRSCHGPKLSVNDWKLYIGELALALKYLHSQGIVYRDLKPENILLDEDGHVKLIDFGLSKVIEDVTSTFCGTPEYMAPELVRKEPYAFSIDWWALGILSYELLFGKAPFRDPNPARLFTMITTVDPKFPDDADERVVDFISGLLQKDPKNRSCFTHIEEHPLFADCSFEDLLAKKVRMPRIPVVGDRRMPENFDDVFTQEKAIDSLVTPVSEEQCAGFSFTGVDEIRSFHGPFEQRVTEPL
jgi:serine/threonine protein kinase